MMRFVKRLRRDQLMLAALVVFAAVQLPYKLTRVPPLWWDEGNVVSWARNWVELGHYGLLLAGRPLPENSVTLTVGFPAVAPIALSFRLVGIGIWQARLPGVVFTMGALAALWLLARRLYDRSVATLTLGAALLLPVLPDVHPVVMGRQALGEMPAIFYLLMGLLCLQRAWGRPRRFLPPAVVFWGLCLQTKPQAVPFLTAALVLPLALLLHKHRFREARILGFGLVGALVTSVLLSRLWSVMLDSRVSSSTPAGSTFAAITASPARLLFNVFQLDPGVRLETLSMALLLATPVLLGLCYTGWRFARDLDRMDTADERFVGRVVLWTLTASWFSWYVLLSIGWLRYLFPAAFLGNVFTAVLLDHLTDGLTVAPWKRWAAVRREPGVTISKIGRLASLVALPIALLLTVYFTYARLDIGGGSSALLETARFLNANTGRDALIEMDDRELFFLVERDYHYPNGGVHHQLKRRAFLGEHVTLDYDPLAADPDYLVVGPQSRMWELYDPILETDAFRLVYTNERYQVYKRVRAEGVDKGAGE
ncbi:MAG: glycosyltransferase family 39 protein [Chloroflexota bacterium]|nr:glycosyltransferase family 39 protein [Chloroflexota bacterium]